jgi:hypothetical protein
MSCAQDMSANTPGLCIYNTLKTIPGITSLEAYGKDADFIRYFYRDAKGKETSSTLMIGTSGTPPRTWFEGAFPIVPDDPVAKGADQSRTNAMWTRASWTKLLLSAVRQP